MRQIQRRMSCVFMVVALVFSIGAMNGCTVLGLVDDVPSYLETQYKSLAVAQETYNTIWGGFKMLYDTGTTNDEGKLIIDQATYDKGFKAATAYYNAWQLWMDTVLNYEVEATGKETVEEKATAFRDVSTEFINLLTPYITD